VLVLLDVGLREGTGLQLAETLRVQHSGLAPDALQVLEAYPWPGNVRELQSAIRHAYVQSAGEIITRDCLPGHLQGELSGPQQPQAPPQPQPQSDPGLVEVTELVLRLIGTGESDIYDKVYAAVDRVVLETVLRQLKGSQSQASEILGISRTTLRSKLRGLGMAIEKQPVSESGQLG
jgi:DNA-binding NtrC family response regulator